MGKFARLSLGLGLILVFVSLISVNSLPTEGTTVVNILHVVAETNNKISQCHLDAECGNGKCINSTICECSRGWITNEKDIGTTAPCNYEQRSKKTAFFLSLFLGEFGADWFYLSRSNLTYILIGVLKLLLGCLSGIAWSLARFGTSSESNKMKIRNINGCITLLVLTWWIVDWARILGNRFPDGNSTGLLPW